MADLAEAFEQHLKSLSDQEWEALTERVRPKSNPSKGAGGRAEAQRRSARKATAR